MASARPIAFRQVEGGLRLLLWATGLSLVLFAIQRVVYAVLFGKIFAASWLDGGLVQAVTRGFQLAWLGVGVVKMAGAAPLARLPGPRVFAGQAGPYRGAPDAVGASPVAPLARALLWLFVAAFALELLTDVLFELASIDELDEGPGVREAVWALASTADLAALGALALWGWRAAREVGAALPAAAPIAAVATGAARSALMALRMLGPKELPRSEPLRWLLDLAMVAECLAVIAMLWLLLKALRARAREDEEEPGAGEAPRARSGRRAPDAALWLDLASAVRGYAAAIKVRLGVLLVGYALLVVVGLSGDQELSKMLIVLLPIVAAVIGVIMVLCLARLLKVPASVDGDGPALLGLVLVLLASFADLYAFSLVLDLLSDRVWKAFDAMDKMPYVEVASQALSLGALLSLLTLFRRIARFLCDAELDRRCGSVAALIGALMVLAIGVRVAIENRVVRGESVLLLAAPLLVGAVVALVRYLGILRDLHAAMDRYAFEGGDGSAVGA